MTRPQAIVAVALAALALVVGPVCAQDPMGILGPERAGGVLAPDPMGRPPLDPSPAPSEELARDSSDGSADNPEELAAPEGAAADPAEHEASRLISFNQAQNPWLPTEGDCHPGWQQELQVPPSMLDCSCDGKLPGDKCGLWRSFHKPTHPDLKLDCISCVKEPYLSHTKVWYTTDAVVQKCFVSEEPFCDKDCDDGRCIERRGTKTVKQLHPCKAQVKLFYWKPVVKYRDVYYYINCEPCRKGDECVALRKRSLTE